MLLTGYSVLKDANAYFRSSTGTIRNDLAFDHHASNRSIVVIDEKNNLIEVNEQFLSEHRVECVALKAHIREQAVFPTLDAQKLLAEIAQTNQHIALPLDLILPENERKQVVAEVHLAVNMNEERYLLLVF
jgi:flagellar motility protein MotE (MotC chaperone)